jgi:hypothetical protein
MRCWPYLLCMSTIFSCPDSPLTVSSLAVEQVHAPSSQPPFFVFFSRCCNAPPVCRLPRYHQYPPALVNPHVTQTFCPPLCSSSLFYRTCRTVTSVPVRPRLSPRTRRRACLPSTQTPVPRTIQPHGAHAAFLFPYSSFKPPVIWSTTLLGAGPTPRTVMLPASIWVRPASWITSDVMPRLRARPSSSSSASCDLACTAILACPCRSQRRSSAAAAALPPLPCRESVL